MTLISLYLNPTQLTSFLTFFIRLQDFTYQSKETNPQDVVPNLTIITFIRKDQNLINLDSTFTIITIVIKPLTSHLIIKITKIKQIKFILNNIYFPKSNLKIQNFTLIPKLLKYLTYKNDQLFQIHEIKIRKLY